jgi:type IV pilus biogenesis protein CpaD/CtpE
MNRRIVRVALAVAIVAGLSGCMDPVGPNPPDDEKKQEGGKDQQGFAAVAPAVLV